MKALTGFTKDELAKIWCELNSWRIPVELKNEIKTVGYKPTVEEVSPYMNAISKKIGLKACLAKWNEIMDKAQ